MPPDENGTELKDVDQDDHAIGRHQTLEPTCDYPNSDPYDTKPGEKPYKMEIAWIHVLKFAYLHVACVIAIFLPITGFLYSVFSSLGITAGAHRYWAHKSYKVTRPLFLILLILQTAGLQDCVINWVRDHRVHHKYSDTNADPHNSTRGFFYSHIGWMMCKVHPDVVKYGRRIDMSDLTSDPLLRLQKKYYFPLAVCTFFLPVFMCAYFLDASFWAACHWNVLRYMVVLHIALCVNSVSHIWGNRPFDKDVKSTDTYAMGFITFGEGWHNYHHVYPFDYRCSELPRYWCNLTTSFIDFFAWLGWAYDLKTASCEMVRRRALRTGDGSHPDPKEEKRKTAIDMTKIYKEKCNETEKERADLRLICDHYWGWGDDDMMQEDINDVNIINAETK